MRQTLHVLAVLMLGLSFENVAQAQVPFCPPNLNFEQGNLSQWKLYTGSCCPIVANTLANNPVNNRHTLTSGNGTDLYGGFPVVAPGGGSYSLKLGNHNVNAQAERARYYIRVPAGATDYSLIYRYAVVFEDPGHDVSEQPRFEVKAYDSATNAPIVCAQHTYIAASNLPGFQLSSVGSDVYYKSWTTASLDLSGFAGKTVAVDFSSGDCALGGHFGYGYVDMDCGLFQVSTVNCAGTTTTLTAPPGFQNYVWMDSTYSTVVGTGQSITIPVPALNTKYNVILTPFAGFGCVDTLSTRVNVSTLSLVGATQDTVVCNTGSTLQLSAGVVGNAPPFTYSWTGPGLSCTSCASPSIIPTTNGTYTVTVTDNTGCVKRDTINVGVSPQLSHTVQNVNCYGAATGSITVTATAGNIPTTFSYLWNTQPAQTTPTATGLPAGTHTVTVTDNHGCTKTASIPVTQPTQLSAQISKTDVSCFGGANGTAVVSATGATPPYTYSWNTSQTSTNLSSLSAGNYTAIVTDSKGCKDTVTATVAQPPLLSATTILANGAKCFGTATGKAYVIAAGGTPPYAYQWSGTTQQTDTASNLSAGTYTVTITDAKGCVTTASVSVTQPAQLVAAAQATPALCYGTSTGTVSATATGGTGPVSYAWNTIPVAYVPSSGNMPAGTYTVTATDSAGCTSTATAIVTHPSALNLSLTGTTPASCFGGSNGTVTVTANGGSSPYAYSWNTSPVQTGNVATGLPAGTVTATVTDANGCTDTVIATVAQPSSAVSLTAVTANNALCYGSSTGRAYTVATGGTQPYSYQWNSSPAQTTDTASNLSAGTYIVTVIDSRGCSDTASVVIAQPSPLSLTTSQTTASCNGVPNGTATVAVTGGTPPMAYSWGTTPVQTTPTASGLAAGTYSVTVTDAHGCIATGSATVTQPAQLSASISTVGAHCYGAATGSITAITTGGTAPMSYAWNTTPIQTTATATGLSAGSYTVTITDAAGCTTTATSVISQPPVLALSAQSTTPVSCFGGSNGSASVGANGGTAPYMYSWNSSPVQTSSNANGLPAGTYIATVTDANGCSDTQTVIIAQPTVLVANAVKVSDVLCHGGTTGRAYAVVTGGVQPYTYQWLGGSVSQQNDTASNLTAGTYTLVVMDGNGCADSSSVTIAQPALLTTSIATTPVSCFGMTTGGASVTATGGTAPFSYLWNTTPAQTANSLSGIAAGSYSVTVTDGHGCMAVGSVTVTQPALLTASTTATAAQCYGTATGTSTVTVMGGTAPMTYSWNTSPVQTTSNATGLPAGSYTVTVTDGAGCTATATSVVSQPSILDLAVQGTTPVSCADGSNGTASVLASGGTSPYAYSWSTAPAQTSAMATGLSAGTFVATVTDANGCTNTQSVTITQPTGLVVSTVKVSDVLCHGGSTGKAFTFASGGTQPYSYQWSTSSPQLTDTAFNLASGVYTATVTDANGCVATSQVSITQPTLLAVSASPSAVLCFGTATGSAAAITSGGTPPMTYSWNTTPIQTTPTATSLSSGSYVITVTDSNGCTANANVSIATPAPLDLSLLSATPASCFGFANGAATVVGSGGTAPLSYSWNTTPTTTTASVANLGAGTYQATVTDINGCQDSVSVTITQPVALEASAIETHKTCPDERRGSAYVYASGGTPPLTYQWNSTPTQIGNALLQVGPGNYSVTVTDQNGCSVAAPVVVGAYPKPDVVATKDTTVCEGSILQLNASGAPSLVWSPAAGLSCVACASPSLRAVNTTTYSVIGTNQWFCSDTDAVTVTVYPRVPVSVGAELNICVGESAQLSASGGMAYQWSPSTGLNDPASAHPTARPDTTTRYTVYITESPCFTDTLHQWVHVHPRPTVNAGYDFHGLPGQSVTLAAAVTNANKVAWTPEEGLSCSSCPKTTATLGNTSTTYTATATSDKGCTASDDVTVTIGCDGRAFFIPNSFTPNGDGQNDRFYPRGPGVSAITSFRVYNRWGEVVFDGQNVPADCTSCGWDGTHRGMPMKPDVYVFLLETRCPDGETLRVQGDISLLR